jgi:hypothetical protein
LDFRKAFIIKPLGKTDRADAELWQAVKAAVAVAPPAKMASI